MFLISRLGCRQFSGGVGAWGWWERDGWKVKGIRKGIRKRIARKKRLSESGVPMFVCIDVQGVGFLFSSFILFTRGFNLFNASVCA